MTKEQEQLIEQALIYIRKYAPLFNVLVYSPILAQLIIESNWGKSNKVINNGKWMHNYLGLKWRDDGRCPIATGWFTETGSEQDANTGEYHTSEMRWCKFNSLEDCILGYFQWTSIARYSKAKGVTDPEEYITRMKEASYATSINYVQTIMNKIRELDLVRFDPVTEEQEKPTIKPKVCIDPGHYGKYNRSPGNSAYYESETMWKLHIMQKKYLEQFGIEVITTRKDPEKDLALISRGQVAKGCDLFISDHTNAVGSAMNESVDYVAVYHLTDDATVACDDISKEFANKIAPVIAEVMDTKQAHRVLSRKSSNDRNGDGVLNDNYYAVLHAARSVNVPGLILEHSFHTNTRTVNWLLDDSNLDKLARAEAQCIAGILLKKTFSPGNATTTPAPESPKVLYKVQVGAYRNKEKAEEQLKAVLADGFNAFVNQIDGLYKVQVGAYSNKSNADAMLAKVKAAGFNAFIAMVGEIATSTSATSKFYSKYTGASKEIDVVFRSIGVPEKFIGNRMKRKPIATANGISNYTGTAAQNLSLIALAKKGKLKTV